MTVEEFKEQINFASVAIRKKTNMPGEVKVFVKFMSHTHCINVKEVGFDDESGTIYIETRE